jgi:hypothetical protein
MTIEWLAGNRIQGTSTERTTTSGFNQTSAVIAGWKEVASAEVTSGTSTTMTASIPSASQGKQYYAYLVYGKKSVSGDVRFQINGDTGNNYTQRNEIQTTNGSVASYVYSGSQIPSQMNISGDPTATGDAFFGWGFIKNKSGSSLFLGGGQWQGTGTSASSIGNKVHTTNRWFKSEAITEIKAQNTTFDAGSILKILAWDPDDTHTTNYWTQLATNNETSVTSSSTGIISAKRFLWIQAYLDPSSSTRLDINFNNDTGSRYARTGTSNYSNSGYNSPDQTTLAVAGTDATPKFVNMFFYNDDANAKLGVAQATNRGTTGNNLPNSQINGLKWSPSTLSDQITEIDFVQGDGASMNRIAYTVWGAD